MSKDTLIDFDQWYLEKYGVEPFQEGETEETVCIQQAQREAFKDAVELTLMHLLEKFKDKD